MNRIKNQIIFFIFALGFTQISHVQGKWKEWTAPKLQSSDLLKSKIPIDEQRRLLIIYEHKICLALTPCSEATMTSDNAHIVSECTIAAHRISQTRLPAGFPDSIDKNLKIYHQSLINGEKKVANSWATKGMLSGSLLDSFSLWEIDTCSVGSIPQKIRRLYSMDKMSQTTLVSCKEIDEMYAQNESAPTSISK